MKNEEETQGDMNDKPELSHLPNRIDISKGPSEALLNGLVERARKDASLLSARRSNTFVACVRIGKKWGLIDTAGRYVVDPIHYDIRDFSFGLAAFSASPTDRRLYEKFIDNQFNSDLGLWGYLDSTGGVAIRPTFERSRGFSERLASAALNGKWGFIQHNGEFVIAPSFKGVSDFKEGLALARVGDKCGFIDKSGKLLIEPRFDLAGNFSSGLSAVMVGGKYGFIDHTGASVIRPVFESASDFKGGFAVVQKDERQSIIDAHGNIIFQCPDRGESIGDFANGIALVTEAGGYWDHGYFINTVGVCILEKDPEYGDGLDATADFSEGLGMVGKSVVDFHHGRFPLHRYADREGSTRLYGWVDANGDMAIEPEFYSAAPFHSGMAVVDPNGNGHVGFIDRMGRVVIEPRFKAARSFSNGFAKVKADVAGHEKWGFIDQSGAVVIPYRFNLRDGVGDFQSVPKNPNP